MLPRLCAWFALWLMPTAAGATPASPPATVRVWATTRLEAASREVADEAGARWLEVEGRLASELGEPIAAAELRFDRPGGSERCSTDPAGRCRVRLRAPPGDPPWVAHFDGGERLRPCAAPVPTTARPPAANAWAVFLPLFLLGSAALAALAVFGARRLRPLWRRWQAAWRRRGAATRRSACGQPAGRTPGRERRIRVLDALRFRPVAGARFVPVAEPDAPLAATDGDGWAELPGETGGVVAQAPGYLPEAVPPLPTLPDGAATDRLELLRGRDAVMVLLEAPAGPEGRPAGVWPESVLRIARRVFPPNEAERVARLCYRRPGPTEPADRQVIDTLAGRAGTPDAPIRYPSSPDVLVALASEHPPIAPRADATTGPVPPGPPRTLRG
ncbi:MAG: hypothetical protein JXB32_17855 [Deltaproteobacteria bacterium]|nr:hypothetical protein [Deltaproteobacteria bacterium]